ncbi:MAG: hypothetical protein AAF085_14825 [Planctomycetota bacterium]
MRNKQSITSGLNGEHYADTLLEMREMCEQKGLNFRTVMMGLAQSWIDANTNEKHEDTDADQTRQT